MEFIYKKNQIIIVNNDKLKYNEKIFQYSRGKENKIDFNEKKIPTMIYKNLSNKLNKIYLFGKSFVEYNYNKCKIIIDNKEIEIKEELIIDSNLKSKKVKLKLLSILINASNMFGTSLELIKNISNINTKYVKYMCGMFSQCDLLKSLPDISK